jgi:hypothetical protein
LLFLSSLVVALQQYYTAKVTTFGCTSIEEVSQLQSIRSDQKAFQTALTEQQLYGECVTILQGTVVEGSIETTDTHTAGEHAGRPTRVRSAFGRLKGTDGKR